MKGHQGGSLGGREVSAARRKRDARRRRSEEAAWAAQSGPVIVRTFRQRCSGCDSSRLEWMTVGDRVHDQEQDHGDWGRINDWLSELSEGVGVPVGPQLLALEAWKCRDCGHSGVFGPVEVG